MKKLDVAGFLPADDPSKKLRKPVPVEPEAPAEQKLDATRVLEPNEDPTAGRLKSAAGNVLSGFGSMVASVPKAVSEISAPLQGNDPDTSVGGEIGNSIQGFFDDLVHTNKKYDEEFVTGTLATGAGTMLGFIGGGLAGAALKAGKYAVPLGLGAASVGVEGTEDLKATVQRQGEKTEDIDPLERFKTFGANAILGTSEAVPIGRLLGRLDHVTGGEVGKVWKHALKSGAKGTMEEMTQEVFQNVGQNLIAKNLLEYDPERDTFEGTVEAGAAGGILGGVFNSLAGAIGGRRARNLAQRAKAEADLIKEEAEKASKQIDVAEITPDEEIVMEGEQIPGADLGGRSSGAKKLPIDEPLPKVSTKGIEVGEVTQEEIVAPPTSPDLHRANSGVYQGGIEAQELELPDEIYMDDGTPFRSDAEARAFREGKGLTTHVVVPTEDGFVLRSIDAQIDIAANEAATSPLNDLPEPSDLQKAAGNYRKGRLPPIHGLRIKIENPKGSNRTGTDPSGRRWTMPLKEHYGYIEGTKGRDGDPLDVFVGPQVSDIKAPVVVVNQKVIGQKKFDEHKIMLGYPNRAAAERAYLSNYEQGWLQKQGGKLDTTVMSVEQFRAWTKKEGSGQSRAVAPLSLRDIRLTKAVTVKETGEKVEIDISAQTAVSRLNKRLNGLHDLMRCVSS